MLSNSIGFFEKTPLEPLWKSVNKIVAAYKFPSRNIERALILKSIAACNKMDLLILQMVKNHLKEDQFY